MTPETRAVAGKPRKTPGKPREPREILGKIPGMAGKPPDKRRETPGTPG
jgi:hypothetical protein